MAFSKSDEFSPDLQNISVFTKALSHPARLSILIELSKQKKTFCGELVSVLPLAQSTVSQHLKELVKSGLVNVTQMGTNMAYSINKRQLKVLLTQLEDNFSIIFKNIKKEKQSKNN